MKVYPISVPYVLVCMYEKLYYRQTSHPQGKDMLGGQHRDTNKNEKGQQILVKTNLPY